ncbi:MAG: hypothetical protein WCE62_05035 [Polyangiales bacterium]
MTGKNKVRRSGTRLRKHGALWFQQTRTAGETFVAETRTAGATFARDLQAARHKLLVTTGRSAQGLQSAVRKEWLDWRDLVLQTPEAYVKALHERLEEAGRQALDAREALKVGTVETSVLKSASELLDRAQNRVDERLQRVATASKPGTGKAAGKTNAAKKGQIPLRNYDELTAKDLVSKVQKLSAPQAAAVLDYELARKKRATVIRAVEQRLAAAS